MEGDDGYEGQGAGQPAYEDIAGIVLASQEAEDTQGDDGSGQGCLEGDAQAVGGYVKPSEVDG